MHEEPFVEYCPKIRDRMHNLTMWSTPEEWDEIVNHVIDCPDCQADARWKPKPAWRFVVLMTWLVYSGLVIVPDLEYPHNVGLVLANMLLAFTLAIKRVV